MQILDSEEPQFYEFPLNPSFALALYPWETLRQDSNRATKGICYTKDGLKAGC